MIKLSLRLQAIANEVDDNVNIVDIGCDHGLLDVYLAKEKKNIHLIASDINSNALNNAKENIKKYQVQNKITTILSNGLNDIDTSNINTMIIAGMGSHTIAGILYQNLDKLKSVDTLILQSNNDLDFLRYKVSKIGYFFEKEKLVCDSGIIYTILICKKGHRIYTKKQLYFGPYLLKENSKLFQKKCKLELEKLESFYSLIPKNHWHHRYQTYWKIKTIKKLLSN